MQYNYAISLCKVSDPVFISDYYEFIRHLKKKHPYSEFEYHFEEKRSGCCDRLHLHGTIINNRKIKMSTLTKPYKKGWSILWKEDPDIGWDRYINKYQEYETDLINREHEKEKEFIEFQKRSEGGVYDGALPTSFSSPSGVCIPDDYDSHKYRFPELDIRKLIS